eukprot:365582-Chlamydomonas_euryale.AAC.10
MSSKLSLEAGQLLASKGQLGYNGWPTMAAALHRQNVMVSSIMAIFGRGAPRAVAQFARKLFPEMRPPGLVGMSALPCRCRSAPASACPTRLLGAAGHFSNQMVPTEALGCLHGGAGKSESVKKRYKDKAFKKATHFSRLGPYTYKHCVAQQWATHSGLPACSSGDLAADAHSASSADMSKAKSTAFWYWHCIHEAQDSCNAAPDEENVKWHQTGKPAFVHPRCGMPQSLKAPMPQ